MKKKLEEIAETMRVLYEIPVGGRDDMPFAVYIMKRFLAYMEKDVRDLITQLEETKKQIKK